MSQNDRYVSIAPVSDQTACAALAMQLCGGSLHHVRAACLQNETAPEKLLNRYEKRSEKREKGSEKRSETRLKKL